MQISTGWPARVHRAPVNRGSQLSLMHIGSHPTDGSTLDGDALPDIIHDLRDRGYAFVTLDVLL